ncbi:MAG TPA: site-specific DNA-methyltransferase [Prevotella sp.]|nr:site-specific DNA-methyltransferase [uncultured Prevotella sp.]HRM56695.1 site-specific DNA-methyltransferase [Prevotella sp.]
MGKKIDLQTLRQQIQEFPIDKELKHDLLEAISDKKRYGLVWEESEEEAQEIMQEYLPVFKEDESKRLDSVPEGSPNHVLIEGDNLNALTALTYTHAGKIDVIYIDPPYNTGNKDFVYNDSFVDKEDGYRHSKWLSFMDKRLKIAKKLLSDKGVIFISIDDNEQASLRLLCDEVFGEHNCLVNMVWDLGSGTSAGHFTRAHEYILVYALNRNNIPNFSGGEGVIDDRAIKKKSIKNAESEYFFKAGTKFEASDGFELTGEWGGSEKTRLVKGRFICENKQLKEDVVLAACWTQRNQMDSFFSGKETFDSKGQKVLEFYFRDNGKLYCRKERDTINPPSVLRNIATTKQGSALLKDMFDGQVVFDFSKPIKLLQFLLSLRSPNAIVLDFFAGSGTTLHATMQLNSEDGGHRQCILVTNNENGICEKVTYERNKRVIQGYTTPKGEQVPGLTNNNLRYYKTEFVPRENSVKNRRALMASCIDLLCIKNNIYHEEESFGGRKFKKSVLRYFKNNAGQMLVVLDERVVSLIVPMIAEVATKDNPLKVYVYSDGAYAYDDEFKEVLPFIELSALPAAFIQALESEDVLPEQKVKEEEIAEFNEEEMQEALHDTYNYVEKKGDNDND